MWENHPCLPHQLLGITLLLIFSGSPLEPDGFDGHAGEGKSTALSLMGS